MLWVFKPQFISNFVDSLITIDKFVFGDVNDSGLIYFIGDNIIYALQSGLM